MKVCITEKPSVARDIARLIGANDRHEGYYEGNGRICRKQISVCERI